MDQMVDCEFCGTSVSGGSAFTCTYCKGTFCPAHRLPFNHACPNIAEWRNANPGKQKVLSRKPESRIMADQKSLIAGGVLMLFLIILFVWIFRIV
ncbi:MAG: hypothetical protein LUQ50_12920 [Methanospirillum sp.]|nr:hypothetical protein [Methanospirillum sp.]